MATFGDELQEVSRDDLPAPSVAMTDRSLIVASDVSSLDLGSTTPKGAWYNWALGGATATTFGAEISVTLHPLFRQQGAVRFSASTVEPPCPTVVAAGGRMVWCGGAHRQ